MAKVARCVDRRAHARVALVERWSPVGGDVRQEQEGVPGGLDDAAVLTRDGARLRRPASREAIAHAFLAEYHRLLADALPDLEPAGAPASVRQRAFAWRVTAARIPLVPDRCWPTWLLEHLHAAVATPVVGPEYQKQRELLVDLLADSASAGPRRRPAAVSTPSAADLGRYCISDK